MEFGNNEETKAVDPEKWINAGYSKFESPRLGRAEYGLQKEIKDEKGIKYHITVWVYNYGKIHGYEGYPWGFEPKVQFSCEITTDVVLHSNDPETVEKKFEELWLALGKPYYTVF